MATRNVRTNDIDFINIDESSVDTFEEPAKPGADHATEPARPRVVISAGGAHPDLATHDALGLATDAELTTHAGAADPHTVYRLESADHTHQSAGLQAGQLDHGLALTGLSDDDHTLYALDSDLTAHEAAADPHTGYRLESADHDHSASGLQAGATLTPGTLNLPSAAVPAQTAEGQVVWDSNDDLLTVGDGTSRETFLPVDDAVSNPTTSDIGDTATDGTEATVARKDHIHGFPAPGAGYPTAVDIGDAQTDGTATTPARSDHQHAVAAPATGYPVNVDDAAEADGTATTPARSDHKHALRVRVEDEGVALGTGVHTLDFVGAGVTVTEASQQATVTISGGGSGVTVQEDDSTVDAAATTLDFGTGFDVTSSPAGEANIAFDGQEAAGLALSGVPKIVRKTADETVTNSTAFQSDDHLALPVGASEVWFVQCWMLISSESATADIKFQWTAPAAATFDWGAGANSGNTPWSRGAVAATIGTLESLTTTLPTGTLVTGAARMGVWLAGVYAGGGTAGTLQLQWAQNTAGGAGIDTTILTNSFIMAWRLA